MPGTVLERLLEFEELPAHRLWLTWRQLDEEATAIAVASSRTQHRLDVAENPTADADVLARLAYDVEPRVRFVYAVLLSEFGRPSPPEALMALAGDTNPKVRRMISGAPGIPAAVQHRLVEDEDPDVRAGVLTPKLWERLPEPVRERLLDDPAPRVREKIAELFRTEEEPEALTAEARVVHADANVRRDAAGDPAVPLMLVLRLAEDLEDEVRLALSMREDLTEEQRASIPYLVPDWCPRPSWIQERAADPGTARRIAASAHVGLRRALAMQPHLPADVVARLAADEDLGVRRNLCACQDAPHELLVEVYATAQDRNWSALRHHRNFARPGLARFADDPNPRLRHAALDDPEAGPELPLRLADDPDIGVWAVRDPRLPATELLRRLTLPDSAFAAAANPALPPAVMHQLVDLARSQ
ncbi:HEAT repeat domain-containing protein [Streptomyces sp. NPDC058220]|uniref:HEAT repeat domain-containing protein n=1 Tax=Streptomyces sp. NPDC058220 TaxID=3346387 RepID=UPI0036E23290